MFSIHSQVEARVVALAALRRASRARRLHRAIGREIAAPADAVIGQHGVGVRAHVSPISATAQSAATAAAAMARWMASSLIGMGSTLKSAMTARAADRAPAAERCARDRPPSAGR